jgi:hypothetical protein
MPNYFLLLRYKFFFLISLFSSAYFNKGLEAFPITKTGNGIRLLPVKKAFMISILVLLLTKVTALSQQGSSSLRYVMSGFRFHVYNESGWERNDNLYWDSLAA